MNPCNWRFLTNTVWSDLPALQVISIRILRRLAARDEHWAKELLDQVVVDNAIEEWCDQAT
jgi:protein PhnA